MRSEYDFPEGVRGKHHRAMAAGYTITIHNADGTKVTKEVMPKEGSRFKFFFKKLELRRLF
jgi:hypothetical protein